MSPIALTYNCHRHVENTQMYLTGIVEIFKKLPITLESWAEEKNSLWFIKIMFLKDQVTCMKNGIVFPNAL